MARLPSRDDLGPLPSARSGRAIARADTSAVGESAAQFGKSLAVFGGALSVQDDAAQEYETERRFQEFKWDQAKALDQSMREMEPGKADGFSDRWSTGYMESARGFFETVPEKLKPKYDNKLFDTERDFYGSATTFGREEQKRHSIALLDDHKNRVALSGDLDRAKADYEGLLNLNPYLTPIEKDEVRRKGREDIEDLNADWRIRRGDDPIEIMRDLESGRAAAPPRPDDDLSFLREKEGFTPVAKWDYRQYSVGYGTKGRRGEKITEEEAEKRLAAEAGKVSSWIDDNITVPLSGNQHKALVSFGFNLGTDDLDKLKDDINAGEFERVAKRMPSFNRAGGEVNEGLVNRRRDEAALFQTPDAERAASVAGLLEPGNIDLNARPAVKLPNGKIATVASKSFNFDGKEVLIPTVSDDGQMLSDKEAVEQYRKSGKHLGIFDTPANADKYGEQLHKAQDQQYSERPEGSDASGASLPNKYPNLSPERRLARIAQAGVQLEKLKTEREKEIDQLETLAGEGYEPPLEKVEALQENIARLRDPELNQKFAHARGLFVLMDNGRKARPAEVEAFTRELRRKQQEQGASIESQKLLKALDQLDTTMRTELNQDALSWAARVGNAEVAPIDLENPDMLRQRRRTAHEVADYYGQAPQFFTADERNVLAETVEAGGEPMLQTLGKIVDAFGPEDSLVAVQEFGKDMSEAASIGWLMASKGSPAAIKDAAQGMELRRTEGFKSVGPTPKDAQATAVDELGGALAAYPRSETAAINMANLIYETRARRNGETSFNAELWKEALREALGEQTLNGVTYGGIVGQGFFTWGGVPIGGDPIIIPPNIRQDGWHEAVDMLTTDDLTAAGLGRPIGATGKAIDLGRVKAGTLVQMGDGAYAIATGDPSTPGAEKWVYADQPNERGVNQGSAPGTLFILDFNKLAPILIKRRPDLFKGARPPGMMRLGAPGYEDSSAPRKALRKPDDRLERIDEQNRDTRNKLRKLKGLPPEGPFDVPDPAAGNQMAALHEVMRRYDPNPTQPMSEEQLRAIREQDRMDQLRRQEIRDFDREFQRRPAPKR